MILYTAKDGLFAYPREVQRRDEVKGWISLNYKYKKLKIGDVFRLFEPAIRHTEQLVECEGYTMFRLTEKGKYIKRGGRRRFEMSCEGVSADAKVDDLLNIIPKAMEVTAEAKKISIDRNKEQVNGIVVKLVEAKELGLDIVKCDEVDGFVMKLFEQKGYVWEIQNGCEVIVLSKSKPV